MNLDKFTRGRLVDRVDISDELAVFRLRPEEPLSFEAGQYATLALLDGDKAIQRAYSIVSAPHERDLEFFIERVPEGELTPRLWEVRTGSEAILIRRKIVGRFTRVPDATRHLMLATVTGIAPFLSMIRHHAFCLDAGAATDGRFLVLHGASHAHDFGPYLGEMQRWAREDWVDYVPTVSRPWEDEAWTGETGRVEDVTRKHADAHGFAGSGLAAYACGNPQMIENARSLLQRARLPAGQFHEEKYFT